MTRTDTGAGARSTPASAIVEARVRYGETDQMGFVYHAHYLVWCDMGRTELLRALGTSYRELEEGGLLLAVSEASVRYQRAARYDDVVRIETTLSRVASRSVAFDYLITHAESGVVIATATTSLVSLNRDGKVITMPGDLRRMLGENVHER